LSFNFPSFFKFKLYIKKDSEETLNVRSTSAAPFLNTEIGDDQKNIDSDKRNDELVNEKENIEYSNAFELCEINEMKIGSEDEEDFLNKKEAKDCQEIKVKNHEVNNLFIFVIFFSFEDLSMF